MKKPIFFIVMALVSMPVVSLAVLGLTGKFSDKELPKLGTLHSFELSERSGDSVGLDTLKSRAWIASFLPVHCKAKDCDEVHKRLKELQRLFRFKERWRLVTFVQADATKDNVRALARELDADPYKWMFLYGDQDGIRNLVDTDFGLRSYSEKVRFNHLALVDGWGRIRGEYDAFSDRDMKKLIKDTRWLIKKTF